MVHHKSTRYQDRRNGSYGMKEYIINTDSGISFGVFGVSENEARETAEDILSQIVVTSVVECQTPGV